VSGTTARPVPRPSRRTFVLGGLAVSGALLAQGCARMSVDPFSLGVASGEPDHESVVLWTRLAPSPLEPDGHGGMTSSDIDVEWQVSASPTFGVLAAAGTVAARHADAHSVHVVAGGLLPDSDYWYRFRARGHLSPVGRTRTAPSPGAGGRDLVMAFASCAHYEAGYYTAYRHLAADRPDLVLHLGDYIYEYSSTQDRVREHVGALESVTLTDYRLRYAQYKTDRDLQAAHAVAPWLVVPDDHEVENNVAGLVRGDESPRLSPAEWTARRAAAYRAYYENMPLRPAQAPDAARITLFRRVRWGRLATFHMLDTRRFRDDQACGDGWQSCPAAADPARSITGPAQETWLLDGLTRREATWDVLGQQVFFAGRVNDAGDTDMDTWNGYETSRSRIQQGWVDRGVRNPVVLTGDVHTSWANDLKADYRDPASPVIGTELVCTAVSSGGDGTADTAVPSGQLNPHLRFYSNRRGYVRTRITPAQLTADFRAVPGVTRPGAQAETVGSFAVAEGTPGLQSL
jgi:alkaline phosphatase D